MKNPVQELLTAPDTGAATYSPNSRYFGAELAQIEKENQEPQVYLKRRFIAPPDKFSILQLHSVVQGDRIDNLAFQYLGDAERYWLVADANVALRPYQLTEAIGRELRITLPAGIPGAGDV